MYYDLKETGKRIKSLRKQKNMTQEQLAIKNKRGSAESLIALDTSFV